MTIHIPDILLRHYSNPHEFVDEIAFDAICSAWSSGLLTAFLESSSEPSVPSCCVKIIHEWRDRCSSFQDAWCPQIGEVESSLAAQTPSTQTLAASLSIAALVSGTIGEFECDFGENHSLFWGKYAIPSADRIAASSDGNRAIVVVEREGVRSVIEFALFENEWCTTQLPLAHTMLSNKRIALTSANILPAELLERPGVDRWPVFPAITPQLVEHFDTAFDVMRCASPNYSQWVERVLRQIIPNEYVKGSSGSGSWSDLPGCVYMSVYPHPAELAETLIHEASHQYFNLISSVFAVDDGSDRQLYYSGAVKRERPIDRILIAYHAFANVELFYRDYLASGISDPFIHMQLDRTFQLVDQLEVPLRQTKSLTSCGQMLFEPLYERRKAGRMR